MQIKHYFIKYEPCMKHQKCFKIRDREEVGEYTYEIVFKNTSKSFRKEVYGLEEVTLYICWHCV
jgi:hypothetical protein